MQKSLKIVIVTYNALQWLDKCLSNFKHLPENWEVIVVDNNSTDLTIETIKNEYSFVKIYETNCNIGFGKANNIAMKIALDENIDNVLLLNQDAYINVEDIKKLQEIQNKYPDFYIVSPIHYNGTGSALDKNFAGYLKTTEGLINDAVVGKYNQEIYKCNYVNAACWLLSNKCLKDIGGFNPSFFLYGEDDNYLQRVQYHQKYIGIVPTTKVFHDRKYRPERKYFYDEILSFWRTSVLLTLSNPNNNKKRVVKDAQKQIVENIQKSLYTMNVEHFFAYFNLLLKFHKEKKSILSNRKLTEKLNPNFLQS